MKKTITCFSVITILSILSCQIVQRKNHEILHPDVYLLSTERLEQVRDLVQKKDERIQKPLNDLLRECRNLMSRDFPSVMNKAVLPPSSDKHDYYSFGPYWWPDTTKENGLPYIRRDGQRNPETRSSKFDRQAMRIMVQTVHTLSMAYFLTGDESYAKHAVQALRIWFIEPQTKMNPHLEFAQAIPGRVNGRGIGIIETVDFIYLVDAIEILKLSDHFKTRDKQGLIDWFNAYLDWLMTSQHGKDENNWYNNHGTWYDVQIADYALFLGKDSIAQAVCESSKIRRINSQIAPDGSMPHELERTRSMHYSLYNLTAFFTLAKLGEHAGVDLWHYESEDGRSIKQALDFLIPYFNGEVWPYPMIHSVEDTYGSLEKVLRMAYPVYQDTTYRDLLKKLNLLEPADRMDLFYPFL